MVLGGPPGPQIAGVAPGKEELREPHMPNRYLDLYSPLVSLGAPAAFPKPLGPVRFNFGQGLAAPETFPTDVLSACSAEVFASAGGDALEYFDPAGEEIDMLMGHRGLRQRLAEWIHERQGVPIGPDNIILTQGSAQGLALMANTFVGPGDGVIVEETTFRCALHFLRCAGGVIATVPLDEGGMVIDEVADRLESFAARRIRPKVIYTIPTFHLPTGTVLAKDRRDQLLALAEEWNLMILEDNVYAELRYEGEAEQSLLALDRRGSVVQSDSFSKMIAPGIRIGWLAGPTEVTDTFASVRQDLGVSQLLCRMMEAYMSRGELAGHIDRATTLYRSKRDAAMRAMDKHCSAWATYGVPQGSFYLWVELAPGIDWQAVRDDCLARGVYYRPGELFGSPENGAEHFRLAFSYLQEDEIEAGIAVLGEVVRQHSA